MPYHIGSKGSSGCSGYPALKDTGEVMGCHKTRSEAAAQIYAINRSEGNIGKSMVKEGDMVMAPHEEEMYVGRVVHVMTEGMLGMPGSEYSLEASAEEPAILIQLFEMEEGELEETEYFVGAMAKDVMVLPEMANDEEMDKSMSSGSSDDEEDDEEDEIDKAYAGCGCPMCKQLDVTCEQCPQCQSGEMKSDCCSNVVKQAPCWDGYVQRGMKEQNGKMVPNCIPVEKILFDGFAKDYTKVQRERYTI